MRLVSTILRNEILVAICVHGLSSTCFLLRRTTDDKILNVKVCRFLKMTFQGWNLVLSNSGRNSVN